ncbi:MAG: YciI family protein [Burkholderiaceae bacterium]|nr:YciI family protein [Burkholderiaceae bacterium]
MFIVLLKISGSKERASEWMAAHKAWLQQGFDEGVFLASGNLTGQPGGGILVHGLSEAEVQQRLSQDPFVIHGIVTVQVIAIMPSKVDPRLAFLLESQV